jgi:hypothetical protein
MTIFAMPMLLSRTLGARDTFYSSGAPAASRCRLSLNDGEESSSSDAGDDS